MLIPQRYEFSSKSQQYSTKRNTRISCCWYHKGTNFQANHNRIAIFYLLLKLLLIPQRYEFSSKSQRSRGSWKNLDVVADTTKVRIFKQITTQFSFNKFLFWLLLIPQRYEFSSKSQLEYPYARWVLRCCWYHKGTNFQANHNYSNAKVVILFVVADTTKVRIFKQITTAKLARS